MTHTAQRQPAPCAIPTMERQPYDAGLDVRHKLARMVAEAISLIYTDGVLSPADSDVLANAIEVLNCLALRR